MTGAARYHLLTCMRDEGPYLLEWVAHYRLLGVTDITVFTNDCGDGTARMLDRMAELGLLTHVRNRAPRGHNLQRAAFRRAARARMTAGADWILSLDADEFLTVRTGAGRLDDLIAAAEAGGRMDALSVTWRLMGSNGARRFRDVPLWRRFPRGADLSAPTGPMDRVYKTIFRADSFERAGVHRPMLKGGRAGDPRGLVWANGSGRRMPWSEPPDGSRLAASDIGTDLAVIHHYAVKSRAEYVLKQLRGSAAPGLGARFDAAYWQACDRDEAEGPPRRTHGLQAVMAELRSDPVLGRLHETAVALHRRRLRELCTDPRIAAFIAGAPALTEHAIAEASSPTLQAAE